MLKKPSKSAKATTPKTPPAVKKPPPAKTIRPTKTRAKSKPRPDDESPPPLVAITELSSSITNSVKPKKTCGSSTQRTSVSIPVESIEALSAQKISKTGLPYKHYNINANHGSYEFTPSVKQASPFVFPVPLVEGIIVDRTSQFIMQVKVPSLKNSPDLPTWSEEESQVAGWFPPYKIDPADGMPIVRCHCPTTTDVGSLVMKHIPCLLSPSQTKRRTMFTVEAISIDVLDVNDGGNTPEDDDQTNIVPDSLQFSPLRQWIGINQSATNRYVEHYLRHNGFDQLLLSAVNPRNAHFFPISDDTDDESNPRRVFRPQSYIPPSKLPKKQQKLLLPTQDYFFSTLPASNINVEREVDIGDSRLDFHINIEPRDLIGNVVLEVKTPVKSLQIEFPPSRQRKGDPNRVYVSKPVPNLHNRLKRHAGQLQRLAFPFPQNGHSSQELHEVLTNKSVLQTYLTQKQSVSAPIRSNDETSVDSNDQQQQQQQQQQPQRAVILMCFIHDNPGFRINMNNEFQLPPIVQQMHEACREGVELWQANFKLTQNQVELVKYFRIDHTGTLCNVSKDAIYPI